MEHDRKKALRRLGEVRGQSLDRLLWTARELEGVEALLGLVRDGRDAAVRNSSPPAVGDGWGGVGGATAAGRGEEFRQGHSATTLPRSRPHLVAPSPIRVGGARPRVGGPPRPAEAPQGNARGEANRGQQSPAEQNRTAAGAARIYFLGSRGDPGQDLEREVLPRLQPQYTYDMTRYTVLMSQARRRVRGQSSSRRKHLH